MNVRKMYNTVVHAVIYWIQCREIAYLYVSRDGRMFTFDNFYLKNVLRNEIDTIDFCDFIVTTTQ